MLVYCGQTVAYFSYCSAECLFVDPGVHVGQFLPLLLLPHAAKKQRRQLHFQFALLVYEFTTSVRL